MTTGIGFLTLPQGLERVGADTRLKGLSADQITASSILFSAVTAGAATVEDLAPTDITSTFAPISTQLDIVVGLSGNVFLSANIMVTPDTGVDGQHNFLIQFERLVGATWTFIGEAISGAANVQSGVATPENLVGSASLTGLTPGSTESFKLYGGSGDATSGACAGFVRVQTDGSGGGGSGTPIPDSRTINTTAPLAGGGDLTADRTLSLSGTKAQFDTACTDGNFLYVGDVTGFTDEAAQDAIGAMVDASLVYADATPLLTRAALAGDVIASQGSNATTIAAGAVSLAKMANLAAFSFIGNNTGSAATPVALTPAQAKTLLAIAAADVSGLGTSAVIDIGVSGHKIPVFDGAATTWAAGSTWGGEVISIKFTVGNQTEQDVDTAFMSKRSIDDASVLPGMSGTPGAHGFAVDDVVNRSGGIGVMAYAGYSSRFQIIGTHDYDHANGFQVNPFSYTSGTIQDWHSYQSAPMFWNGAVTNFYGFKQFSLDRLSATYSGSLAGYVATAYSSVTNAYAIYVESLGQGTNRYAFYSAGASDQVHIAGFAEVTNRVRVTGNATTPSTGAGMELFYNAGANTAGITAYDRGAAAYKAMDIEGLTVTLRASGAAIAVASSTGLAVTGVVTATGAVTGSNLSGTNTGDQASIVGITGTKAQFDTAVTDGNILYVGDVTQYTDELAQDAIGAMVDASLVYVDGTPLLTRAALTGDATATQGSNALTLATVNSSVGTFGSVTKSAIVTVNAKGLVTAASESTITPAVGSITGFGTGVATALAVNVGSAGAFVTFNGAVGTPSSLTLTNATGLPIAGLVASTSAAIGVGSIELGHATDTTITRVSAGVVAIEGANIIVSGGALGTPASGNLANCTFPTLNQNTTGSAATLTTPRNIDGQAFDGSAAITVIAPGTHAATSKAAPVDADEMPLVDSAASNVLKKLTWANLKATLKTYFDTLYQALNSNLTTLAGLAATTDNFIVSVSSAWASRTPAQVRTTLGLVIGTNVQAWDTDLDATASSGIAGAWASFAPNVTSSAGTITTLGTVTGHYMIVGKTMFVEVTIAITTAGTGAGALHVSNMPGSSPRRQTIVGCEDGSSGKICYGKTSAGTTNLDIVDQNGATLIANGARVQMTGVLEIS